MEKKEFDGKTLVKLLRCAATPIDVCQTGNGCKNCPHDTEETDRADAIRKAMTAVADLLEAYLATGMTPEECEAVNYKLLAVMNAVDKWLDGDELEQDEANRAATMREKTLRIIEDLQAENKRLHEENFWLTTRETTAKE